MPAHDYFSRETETVTVPVGLPAEYTHGSAVQRPPHNALSPPRFGV